MDSHTPETEYSAPKVEDLGTLSEQTLTTINKIGASGDILVVNGTPTTIPGSQIVP
jgi:hypothetical protein